MLQNGEQAKEEACKPQRGLKDASRNWNFLGPGASRCRTLRRAPFWRLYLIWPPRMKSRLDLKTRQLKNSGLLPDAYSVPLAASQTRRTPLEAGMLHNRPHLDPNSFH